MSDFNRGFSRPTPAVADMGVDAGLRAFMLGVYNKVGLGLVVTAALAWLTSSYAPVTSLLFQEVQTPQGIGVTYTMLGWVVAIAPLPVLLLGQFAARQSPAASGIVYWVVVALFGASLGSVGLMYTGESIFSTFLITSIAFGSLSLIGYTTKKDLSGLGSFLIMGLIGLLVASVVNIFLHSGAMYFIINILGVGIFAGLIAFQTQRLKMTYYQLGGNDAALAVATNVGALSLYLDFLNLFLFLLRLMGGRR